MGARRVYRRFSGNARASGSGGGGEKFNKKKSQTPERGDETPQETKKKFGVSLRRNEGRFRLKGRDRFWRGKDREEGELLPKTEKEKREP